MLECTELTYRADTREHDGHVTGTHRRGTKADNMHVIVCVGSRENLDAHKPLRGIADVQVRAIIAQIMEMGKMSFVWLTMVAI